MGAMTDCIVNDIKEGQWKSIFSALASYSIQTAKEEAMHNGIYKDPSKRIPLPLSDPPSPTCND